MSTQHAGTIAELWRFPVKSMRGERLDEAAITARGMLGDRAYAMIDTATGKVVSAKSVKLFPHLLDCQATFVEPPQPDREAPAVRITLPDGRTVASDAGDCDRQLSAFFHRDVTLARAAPPDFTIDQYHPDLEGIDPAGHRDTVVEQKLGAAFFAQAGQPSPVAAGAFFDLFPVSVLTTSTLARLAALRPDSQFDARRFRMNVIVDTGEAGFVENGWVGHAVALGDTARLRVAMPDPRCVMTTLAQDDLPNDTGVLRALAQHNTINVEGAGPCPCAGVYAVVESPGSLRAGERVGVA